MTTKALKDECPRCDGCGQLADTDDREPWTAWTSLPAASRAAVTLGLVKPIPCDDCDGTGERKAVTTVTVYVSIGNTDNKLTQQEWANFVHSFRECVAKFATEVYGDWMSEPSSSYQNACVAIATETPLTLKAALKSLREGYRQDSIAWAEVPKTEFI